ncbi:hypothetical protein EZ449_18310 [Pedobacter frigidisoli]|uniref:Uncharacterized protein n=1 Tax=Pedobacter frigidisoli TaxID=2530455 RepID=A0A4R0NSE4_9SPHI|nr:hypothetical protein [Pedobacter frigidisoli]TCD02315.1 hypothetical protein EZ449_18310 [Pedobacter frigidisoli]
MNNKQEYIPLSGNLTTFTAGVLIGAQWKIANKVYFDWSIFGPQYGFSKGKISGTKTLTLQEQQSLRDELKDLESGQVFVPIWVLVTVSKFIKLYKPLKILGGFFMP